MKTSASSGHGSEPLENECVSPSSRHDHPRQRLAQDESDRQRRHRAHRSAPANRRQQVGTQLQSAIAFVAEGSSGARTPAPLVRRRCDRTLRTTGKVQSDHAVRRARGVAGLAEQQFLTATACSSIRHMLEGLASHSAEGHIDRWRCNHRAGFISAVLRRTLHDGPVDGLRCIYLLHVHGRRRLIVGAADHRQ